MLPNTPEKRIAYVLLHTDPRSFETLLWELWNDYIDGWRARLTPLANDGGRDVVVETTEPRDNPVRVLIQAKRYTGSNRVHTGDVEKFYNRMHRRDEEYDRLLLVTTNTLTRPARRRAEELDVDVMNGRALCSQILRTGATELVHRRTSDHVRDYLIHVYRQYESS